MNNAAAALGLIAVFWTNPTDWEDFFPDDMISVLSGEVAACAGPEELKGLSSAHWYLSF